MKQIRITRDGDKVTFETVSIDTTENVFFINKDPKQPHKPSILKLAPTQLGRALTVVLAMALFAEQASLTSLDTRTGGRTNG